MQDSPRHPIAIYLQQTGMSQGALARAAGVSRPYVTLMISGKRRCGADAAIKIERATRGGVSVAELVRWGRTN